MSMTNTQYNKRRSFLNSGKLVVLATAFAGVSLLGCAEMGIDLGDEPTQGAVVGGAMGAGLGAIIGSQTGSAGAGLAIGGLVGAGTGAAIGSSLQERNEAMRAQEEQLERQQQRIAANRRAIEQLQAGRDPRTAALNRPFSSPATGSAQVDTAISRVETNGIGTDRRAALRAAPLTSSPRSAATVTERELIPSERSSTEATQSRSFESQKVVDQARTGSLSVGVNTSGDSRVAGSTIKAERERIEVPVVPEEIERLSVDQESEVGEKVAEELPKFGGESGAITAGLQTSPKDDDCLIADGELNLAAKAAASADKLFHQRKALRLCPNSARSHIAIAETYLSLGRRSDAEFELREALRIEPSNETAAAKLKEIG
jgi:hypothetical protein